MLQLMMQHKAAFFLALCPRVSRTIRLMSAFESCPRLPDVVYQNPRYRILASMDRPT